MAEWEERTWQSSPLRARREVTHNRAATPDHMTLTVVLMTLTSPLYGGRSLPVGVFGMLRLCFTPGMSFPASDSRFHTNQSSFFLLKLLTTLPKAPRFREASNLAPESVIRLIEMKFALLLCVRQLVLAIFSRVFKSSY